MITRREQLARFYLAEHARLQRIVAREVPAHAVEDACHTAWTVLLRRPDIPLDGRGVAWLRKVALTTGRRTAIRPREQPAGGFLPDPEHPGELPEPPAPGGELADRAIERLHHRAELAALPARQRRLLALHAIGLSYAEIAAREGCTPRTVERQLLRARRALRDADPQP
jgi:RNA polymerase sigma factor (sigma-70 family)